jgi:hypothetical protein
VLALGAALSGSFLGGSAAAEGKIPLPFVKDHPIAFSAGGGVAILVIVLVIGYYIYIRPSQSSTVTRLMRWKYPSKNGTTYNFRAS